VAAKTIATKLVPMNESLPSSTSSMKGTSIAPSRPMTATVWAFHASETATPTEAIPAAMTNAQLCGTNS
jgi:hypothetical protein